MITVPEYKHFSVNQLTPHVGAEIEGVDLAGSLSPELLAELRDAWHRFGVIFFRDQHLTHARHIEVGRMFGESYIVPIEGVNHPEHPELLRLYADENSKYVAGEGWHADISCEQKPCMGAVLYLNEMPPTGGDTLFCSMAEAYRRLSEPMKAFLRGLTAEHSAAKAWVGKFNLTPPPGGFPTAVHPVIARHPVTGEPGIWVNSGFTTRIVELTQPESDAVLNLLYAHIDNPEMCCRFRWTPNTIAIWDNRAVQHRALFNYWPQRRAGWRYTIAGPQPQAL